MPSWAKRLPPGSARLDEALARDDVVEVVIQINGKVRDRVVLPSDASEESAMAAARSADKIASALDGMQIVREIYVPGRLVNFVIKSS